MTYREALKVIQENLNVAEHDNDGINPEYNQYRQEQVDGLRLAKAAIEKQIAKKFEIIKGQDCCPTCKKIFGSDVVRKRLLCWEMDYCKYCGQRLDWGEENE